MRRTIIIFAVLIAGCAQKDEAEEARARYDIVERHGNNGEICDAARELADAYLRARNEKDYELWRAIAAVRCQHAQLVGAGLYPEPKVTPISETLDELASGAPPPE